MLMTLFLDSDFKPITIHTVKDGVPVKKIIPSRTRMEQFVSLDEYLMMLNLTMDKSREFIQNNVLAKETRLPGNWYI